MEDLWENVVRIQNAAVRVTLIKLKAVIMKAMSTKKLWALAIF